MSKFDNGVKYYTAAKVNQMVFFPEKEVKCQYCQFCRAEKDLNRYWCRLTNRMIINPFYDERPKGCPLEIVESEVYA